MYTSTKLGDKFLRIPKLDVAGINWVIYKDQFVWALDVRGILDHIDGTGREPIDPIPNEVRARIAAAAETQTGTTESSDTPSQAVQLTTMQIKLDTDWRKDLKEWKSGEAIAKQQIASSIPDSLL